MKKVLTFCLALSMSVTMWGVEIVKDSLKYNLQIESDRYAVLQSCLKKEGGTVKVEAYLTYENQIYPVREIGAFAFLNSKVSRVYLSYNTQAIHNKAFENSKLEILYLEAETPPAIETTAFKGIDLSQCRLYVPDACIEAYRSADVWKDFGHVGPASLEPVKYVNREWAEWLEHHVSKGCIVESRRIVDAKDLKEMIPQDSKRVFLPEGFYFVSGDLDIHKYGDKIQRS